MTTPITIPTRPILPSIKWTSENGCPTAGCDDSECIYCYAGDEYIFPFVEAAFPSGNVGLNADWCISAFHIGDINTDGAVFLLDTECVEDGHMMWSITRRWQNLDADVEKFVDDYRVRQEDLPVVLHLAFAFSHELYSWFQEDPEDLVGMDDRNRENEYDPSVCSSHDYCDPNMAMWDAFILVLGREPDCASEHDSHIVNAAWLIAKCIGFSTYSNPKQEKGV